MVPTSVKKGFNACGKVVECICPGLHLFYRSEFNLIKFLTLNFVLSGPHQTTVFSALS